MEIELHYNTPVHFSRTKPYKDFLVQHCRLGTLRHTYKALGFDLDTEDRNQLNCKENITPWKYIDSSLFKHFFDVHLLYAVSGRVTRLGTCYFYGFSERSYFPSDRNEVEEILTGQ